MRAESAYAELLRRVREKAVLAGCAELLAWDEATYLPQNGGEHRAAQLALLAGIPIVQPSPIVRGGLKNSPIRCQPAPAKSSPAHPN